MASLSPRPFWTQRKELAAVLVAEDRFTDEAIARRCGVVRKTLAIWKLHPIFAQRVHEHLAAFQAGIRGSTDDLAAVSFEESCRAQEYTIARGFGLVYFVRADNGLVKIGATLHWERRLGILNKPLPYDLEVLRVVRCENPRVLERRLHERFAAVHVRGEWFRLTESQIAEIRSATFDDESPPATAA